ncbi:patatin-like phospholipase family protein [Hydrogenophaga aquatica]
METSETEQQRRREMLVHHLRANFGEIGRSTLRAIFDNVSWVELSAGDVLMEQGQPGDTAYLSLSGRLRVYVRNPDGSSRMVRELGRGEITGEISLYTGAPRSATVVAIRDSLLARIDKPHFDALVARNPQVSLALTNKIINRLQTQHARQPLPAPVMVTLLPITEGLDVEPLAHRLAGMLGQYGRACCVTAESMQARLASLGEPEGGRGEEERLSAALDDLEAEHDFVLMLADPHTSVWTRLCIRHSDEILLMADAQKSAALHPVEQAFLVDQSQRSEAAETLVLLHPQGIKSPLGMRRWLERRAVTGHVNIRPSMDGDIARLARLLSRNAVGLVLAGGGARGFSHLGIWKTLRQHGIEVDCVGGTSMGAVMAAIIAADATAEETIGVAREAFRVNPTGDYTVLPLLSLIKGRRVRSVIERSIRSLMGGSVDIVDLWKNYFCIASNYSQGREMRLDRGDLGQALLASIAIPGALPPVVRDGELLCDGGTFNNFPADVMRDMRGVGRVIGVDLSARNPKRLNFKETPGPWTLLLDRLRPRAKRRYRLPSLVSYLLNVTILYSISRQDESRRHTDLYFNPPLFRVGLLQWDRFDAIVRQGEAHAREVLDALDPADRAAWGLRE